MIIYMLVQWRTQNVDSHFQFTPCGPFVPKGSLLCRERRETLQISFYMYIVKGSQRHVFKSNPHAQNDCWKSNVYDILARVPLGNQAGQGKLKTSCQSDSVDTCTHPNEHTT